MKEKNYLRSVAENVVSPTDGDYSQIRIVMLLNADVVTR